MKMNEITKSITNTIMENMEKTLVYLYCRWQDEKEYEDWQDYVDIMKKDLKEKAGVSNVFFVKASKRPFGLTFDFEGWQITLSVNSTSIRWKAKKI
ncbi:MAG: hypothetical protein DRP09_21050 [Candidatus Thorarchaeota archaeon]|nr:MAG: hypothetical protein DRP09_21050 [Candidatus Thorarchaeota archaeon]